MHGDWLWDMHSNAAVTTSCLSYVLLACVLGRFDTGVCKMGVQELNIPTLGPAVLKVYAVSQSSP